MAPDAKNKFCKVSNLRNESDVEQFFVIQLLHDLGFTDTLIKTKTTIVEVAMEREKEGDNTAQTISPT